MHIQIVGAGKIKEPYLTAGIAEYTKRLAPMCKLQINEVEEERMSERPSAAQKHQVLTREGDRLLKAVRPGSYLMVLDVGGRQYSSEDLSAKLQQLALDGNSAVCFVIGGAFGLSPQVLSAATERISFSRMTFTHQMIRLLLVEQIYRGFKIWRGEPYHW